MTSETTEHRRHRVASAQSSRSLYPPKANADSHTRTDSVSAPVPRELGGQEVVRPPGEDLHGHRLGVVRPDHVEVLVAHDVVDALEGGVEDVEVADHAPVVELLPLDDHVEPVVVLVELPFRALRRRA